MKVVSSSLIAACVVLVQMISASPSGKDQSSMHTLTSRNPSGPFVGQKFANAQGTYWNGSKWVANCLFKGWSQPAGLPYLAVAANLYGSATYCGTCVKVTPLDRKHAPKIGIINDQCADCPPNALDMSPELYNAVMGNAPGRPGISKFDWEVVPCPLPQGSNMQLTVKDGASQYHFSLQIAGTVNSVVGVEVKVGSNWQQASRRDYNYWEIPQGGAGEAPDVRVTCSNNVQVVVPRVTITSENRITARVNC